MRQNNRSVTALLAVLSAVVILSAIAFLSPGCAPVVHLTPQTQATISQDKQAAAVAAAKVKNAADLALVQAKAKAKLNTFNGKSNPIDHPIDATNNLVKQLRPWLIALTVLNFALWIFLVGVGFTSLAFPGLSFLVKLKPIFRWGWILAGSALIALPFLPASFLIIGVAFACLLTYECVKDKGNLVQALLDTELEIGFKTPSPASVSELSATTNSAASAASKAPAASTPTPTLPTPPGPTVAPAAG